MELFDGVSQGARGIAAIDDRCLRLSVVIPAYQEEQRLPSSLERISEYLATSPDLSPAEIVVVDDGSVDDTAAVARGFQPGASAVEMVVLQHAVNRGKGAAVRTGVAASRGALLLLCDADLAAPIEELRVLKEAHSLRRIVIGSRAVDRTLIEALQPRYRDLMGRTFNAVVRALALPGIRDSQCGFKLFPGAAGRALAEHQLIDGFAFDVELLAVARHWGLEVVEVPVRWRHVEASRVQPVRHSAQMLRDVLRLWWRFRRGRVPAIPNELR